MKYLFILLLFLTPLKAQIFADFTTTEGNFTVELYHDRAPKAVANFIGLAEGTRPWINSLTGRIQTSPFYNGITFHRIIDGFVNQFGSLNGLGTDGPGYTFRDEFDPTLNFSTPYLLAMANSGANTNGSQLFTTVGTPVNLNNVHTILGIIPDDGTSRQTIDAINSVDKIPDPNSGLPSSTPVTPVTITNVTIRRIGTDALNFDELAQNLPIPILPNVTLQDSTTLQPSLQNNSIIQIFNSNNLTSWNFAGSTYFDGDDTLPATIDLSNVANNDLIHFYRPALVIYPDPPYIPSSLATSTNLSITTTLGTTTYNFTSLETGTFTHIHPDDSEETGTFTANLDQNTPIKARITLFPQLSNSDGNAYAIQTVISRYETNSATQLSGVHQGALFTLNPTTSFFEFTNNESGTFTLSP